MRFLIIFSLILPLSAADVQQLPREDFTLTDGRTLTGTYSAEDNALLLDGGKAMLHVTPEQIKERCPAKEPLKAQGEPLAAKKTMTAEEKAAALEKFKQAQDAKAGDAQQAEADKLDREAAQLLVKADAFKAKALTAAKSFRDRCTAEGEGHRVEDILSEPLMTKQTSANNAAILGLMKDAERFKAEASEKKALAKEKRAVLKKQRDEVSRRQPVNDRDGDEKWPTTYADCERLRDQLSAQSDLIRINPDRPGSSDYNLHGDKPEDPAWINGTPEFQAREAKLRELSWKIMKLQERMAFMKRDGEMTGPPRQE